MRRATVAFAAIAIVVSACSNLGTGDAVCVGPGRELGPSNINPANILTVQAVPTARYTPCLNELRLGWDSVEWFAEDGRAGIRILRSFSPFLTATVTKSCDVSAATPVESGYPDIERYEDIDSQPVEVEVTIVPSGERPLLRARLILDELEGAEVDDRPVIFTLDENIGDQVAPRVNLALLRGHYVWIIDELEAEEGTVELRSNHPDASGSGLDPDRALDLIEEVVPDTFYRGNWYFTFEGGCITYEFDAKGTLAETVADDADDALGFFPAWELIEIAEDAGFTFD